ncbi:MAG: rhomboid family intramembrane serine protease [Crocinitomicaceae bacterium]
MKVSFNSPVILTFSFLCAIVYLLTSVNIAENLFTLQPEWNFSSVSWYFKFFTHSLGHASSEHLIGNLAFLLLLGPIVEEKYGGKNLVIMLFTCSLVTGLIHVLFFDVALLGASGIVFMLILLASLVNFKNKEIPLTFILIALIYLGKEIMGTFESDNISHSTHIIGGIVGAVFGFSLAGKKAKAKSNNNLDVV